MILEHEPSLPARLRAGDPCARTFTLAHPGEAWVGLTLSAPGTSWRRAETAVVTLDVDGHDQQEIILAAGGDPVEYQRCLGRLSAGPHRLRLAMHRGLSSPVASEVVVDEAHTGCIGDGDPMAAVWRHAPILHYRALTSPLDSLTTDTPLLLFYRTIERGGDSTIEYHAVFSHEDAGTDLIGLLARWGHTVDIEWALRVTLDRTGRIVSEEFQGPAHDTVRYRGGRAMGRHPVLQVSTLNGTFDDRPACPYRTALAPACPQPPGEPREGVLHRFPWIYRVSASEVLRQVPLEAVPTPDLPAPADLRAYLFLQWKRLRGPVIPLEACACVAGVWRTSAWGRLDLAFDEADAESTAVKVPAGAAEVDVTGIALQTLRPPPEPVEVALVRAFFLDEGYRPRPSLAPPAVCSLSAAVRRQTVWTR